MRLWRAGSSQAAILKPVLESRLVSGQNNAPVTRIIMIVGGVMMSEWESMTIELFAVREQMQEVLGAKLKAKKVEPERRLRTLNQWSMKSRPMPPGQAHD
jgi:hypothetical protein